MREHKHGGVRVTRPRAAYVALGANLPHAGLAGADLLAAAVEAMRARGLNVRRVSGAWESPAWPPSDQPDYVNAVAEIDPEDWTPQAMLEALLAVERQFGRERRERWAARTLDLDLIDFDGVVLDMPGLSLPHPRAHERAFVLEPLLELFPDWRHPGTVEKGVNLLATLPVGEIRRLGELPLRDCETPA